jgi:DNA-binding transcriptional MerR regulator
MSSNKKYSSIGEVIKLLNIQAYQLRYLESTLPELTVYKIRNRRYYTNNEIEYLRNHLAKNKNDKEQPIITKSTTNQVQRIDQLINKFRILSGKINELINNGDKGNAI